MSRPGPLSEAEFRAVYEKVPRLTVELLLRREDGAVLLTKRAGGPCKGLWHVPGGTVRFGERLREAVSRVARDELGVEVVTAEQVGVIEYPSHFEHGLDDPVGIIFEVTAFDGEAAAHGEPCDAGWFTELPRPMHGDQDSFLLEHGYLPPG